MSSNKDVLTPIAILLISNDYQWREVLQKALRFLGNVNMVENEESGLKAIRRKLQRGPKYGIIVIDAGTVSGKSPALVQRIQEVQHEAKVVVATAAPTWRQAKESFQMGATDYIRKSLDERDLVSIFQEILRKKLPPRQRADDLAVIR